MNARRILAAIFLLSAMAFAQGNIKIAPDSFPKSGGGADAGRGFMLPGGLKAPNGMFDDFWNDPQIAKKLQLTEDQRTQLEKTAVAKKLELVGDGADLLKSFIKLSALLDAEPFDDAAYQKASGEMAVSAGKTVQSMAEMVAARRRILTADQYAQLRRMQKAKIREARRKAAAEASCRPHRHGSKGREIPSSLERPLH